jgi:hypothetical protein
VDPLRGNILPRPMREHEETPDCSKELRKTSNIQRFPIASRICQTETTDSRHSVCLHCNSNISRTAGFHTQFTHNRQLAFPASPSLETR